MKRAGKCVRKKSFVYRHKAEAQVIRNFVFGNKTYKRKPVEEIMVCAYRLMREHLGLQAPKHTTLKGQLPLTEQRRLLQELTKQQSTGVV